MKPRGYYPPGYYRRKPRKEQQPRLSLKQKILYDIGIFEGFVIVEAMTYAGLGITVLTLYFNGAFG